MSHHVDSLTYDDDGRVFDAEQNHAQQARLTVDGFLQLLKSRGWRILTREELQRLVCWDDLPARIASDDVDLPRALVTAIADACAYRLRKQPARNPVKPPRLAQKGQAMSDEQDRLLYALSKQVPDMRRGFSIATNYGEIAIEGEEACRVAALVDGLLRKRLTKEERRECAKVKGGAK